MERGGRMITAEQAIENLEDIQRRYSWNTAGDETFYLAIKCLRTHGAETLKEFYGDERGKVEE